MSSLRERLNRLRTSEAGLAETARGEGSGEAASGKPEVRARDAIGDAGLPEAFRRLGVEQLANEDGPFLLRRVEYPLAYRHGRHELGDLHACAPHLRPIAVRQNKTSEPIDPRRLLFLDTETTGLGVGTGNVPFMIGFGYLTDSAFVVEQTLIRHPGEERAMLTYLLGRLQDKTHLATYNGRTFDWPVLANRFILNGWRRNGKEPSHLDFLHPSRALWRNTLPSCRLGIVEEARLGIRRGEDVPGSLAPSLYFQFLSDGDPAHLRGVYAHNEKDILTLASLAVHFGKLLGGEDRSSGEALPEGEELYRTAVWLDQHGKSDDAERLFVQLLGLGDRADASWLLPLAARYKKAGKYETSIALWRRLAEHAEAAAIPRWEAHVELAMHYEHRDKKLLTALTYAEKALELAGKRASLIRDAAVRAEASRELKRRVDRLREKVARERKQGQLDLLT
ncbi:ribonuclease H-like domain-containing protein [Paenibacillaceae bacterium WGS1546]|uniref:ribonuclease H-like domain-containing protein n=1 Tax=Cohnella sp. WGS1546 TaxID=3366810 RepID=UPI00372D2273